MKALFTYRRWRIAGTLVALAALAALGVSSAFAEPGRGLDPAIAAALKNRGVELTRDDGQLDAATRAMLGTPRVRIARDDWQRDAATRASVASGESVSLDPAIAAAIRERAAVQPAWANAYSGIESVRSASPVSSSVGSSVSDDDFRWAHAGIGAGMVIALMLLAFLATFLVRLSRHQPRGV